MRFIEFAWEILTLYFFTAVGGNETIKRKHEGEMQLRISANKIKIEIGKLFLLIHVWVSICVC